MADERAESQAAMLNTYESPDAQIMAAGLSSDARAMALAAVDQTAFAIPQNQDALPKVPQAPSRETGPSR